MSPEKGIQQRPSDLPLTVAIPAAVPLHVVVIKRLLLLAALVLVVTTWDYRYSPLRRAADSAGLFQTPRPTCHVEAENDPWAGVNSSFSSDFLQNYTDAHYIFRCLRVGHHLSNGVSAMGINYARG